MGRLLDFHFWTSWSNMAQIYPVIWKNKKQIHRKQWFFKIPDIWEWRTPILRDGKKLGETWNHPQLTYLREPPGCGVRRGAQWGQPNLEPRVRGEQGSWNFKGRRESHGKELRDLQRVPPESSAEDWQEPVHEKKLPTNAKEPLERIRSNSGQKAPKAEKRVCPHQTEQPDDRRTLIEAHTGSCLKGVNNL